MKEEKGKNVIIILLLIIVTILIVFIVLIATKTISLDIGLNNNSKDQEVSNNNDIINEVDNEVQQEAKDNSSTVSEELFEIKYTEEVYSKTTEKGNEVRSLRNLPIVTSNQRKEAAQKMTKYLKDQSDEHWNEAKNMTDQVVTDNIHYEDMGVTLLYNKTIANNNRISFSLQQSGWFGGVGWVFEQGFNFDADTGELLTLKNIGKDTYKIVKEECEKYIEENKNSNIFTLYESEERESLDELLDTAGNWYFEYNHLIVVFPKHSLGVQSIKVSITKSKINDSLYDKYKF